MTLNGDTMYEIDEVTQILDKLPTDLIQKGYRTFDINGEATHVSYKSCFIAMMYGDAGALDTASKEQEISACRIAADTFPTVSFLEFCTLSTVHYYYPELVRSAAQSVLTRRARPMKDLKLDPSVVKAAKSILQRLPVQVVRDGYRTFEINGTEKYVGYESCFVAMMYGDENTLVDDCGGDGNLNGHAAFAAQKFTDYVTVEDIRTRSGLHYGAPYSVKAAADEILGY